MNALPLVLQLGLFATPVAYPLSSLSPKLRVVIELNPLTGVIEAFRAIMLTGFHASAEAIVIGLGATVLMAVSGWRIFSRLETTMADEI